ncbi:MAG: hypothetical protein MRJ93_12890 [Nitrososphaeraceae archaeon]|nr:hypothetical protein [Nitrososphaeraceae archaeon]
MPTYLDVHKISQIGDMINVPGIEDENFKITRINTFCNREEDLIYYLLNATSKDVIEKYHSKFNLKCDSITEVTMM